MSWIILAALLALAVIYVLTPILSEVQETVPTHAAELADLRNELRQIEAKVQSGHLSSADAEVLKHPLAKRVLVILDQQAEDVPKPIKSTAASLFALISVCAFGLYAWLGEPNFDKQAQSDRPLQAADLTQMSPEEVIIVLSQKLANDENPPAKGYQLLGRMLMTQNRTAEATAAYSRALEISNADPSIVAEYERAQQLIQSQTSAPSAPVLDPNTLGAFEGMSPTERDEMINSMVERVAIRVQEVPTDLEGWKRLLQARRVIGQVPLAQSELDRGLEQLAKDDEVRVALVAIARDLGYEVTE